MSTTYERIFKCLTGQYGRKNVIEFNKVLAGCLIVRWAFLQLESPVFLMVIWDMNTKWFFTCRSMGVT